MKNFDVSIAGNHKLQTAVLAILPLIPEHFAPMNGKRITIASGDKSAAFRKACDSFRDACNQVCDAQIWVDSEYSPRINVKVNVPRDGCSVAYFETSVYLGDQDNQELRYTFNHEQHEYHANQVLNIDSEALNAVADTYREQLQKAHNTLETLPHPFRSLIRAL